MTTMYNLLIVPIVDMVMKVASFIPTLFYALIYMVIGLLIAKFLHDVIVRVLHEVHIDMLADTIGLTKMMNKGGIKHTIGDLIGSFVYLTTVLIFLVLTLQLLGMSTMGDLMSVLVAYLPQVVSAVFVLVIGIVLAKMVSAVIYVIASNLDVANPGVLKSISRWAILIYAAKVGIEELGLGTIFVGTTFHILFAGVVLAFALAYGLDKDSVLHHLSDKKK